MNASDSGSWEAIRHIELADIQRRLAALEIEQRQIWTELRRLAAADERIERLAARLRESEAAMAALRRRLEQLDERGEPARLSRPPMPDWLLWLVASLILALIYAFFGRPSPHKAETHDLGMPGQLGIDQ